MTTIYSVGTVTVANGGTAVTGVGTSWVGKIFEGDLFTDPAQGLFARVTADVTDNELMTINPWPGVGMSGDAYEVVLQADSIRSSERSRQLLEQLSVVQANGRGLFYWFSTTVTDADPGAGYLRLNHATIGSATAAYVDNLDADGAAVSTEIDTWDDSTSTNRGKLWLRSIADPASFHAFWVTGSVVDGTGYRKLTLSHIGGSGSFAADDELMAFFVPKGDKGDPTTDASLLTTGLLDVARIPATLTSDKAYRRGNVLGTVSQASGVPTGALVERGSNANGEYIRFADGTQICLSEFTGASTSSTLWSKSLPANFFGSTNIFVAGAEFQQSSLLRRTDFSFYANTTSVLLYAADGSATTLTYPVRVISIGRWF